MRILMAEDERVFAYALQLKLEKSGHEVDVVYDGEDAINKLHDKYDVVLLDVVMPRKDGFYVLKKINKLNLKTPVIMVSNLNDPNDVNLAKELGAKTYLVKVDLTLDEIVYFVEKYT